jgi:translation initiation factor IF-3
VGRRIRAPEVRVIAGDGAQVGILPTYEALKLAEEQGLELVEVNPRAVPPVCRIMDFGKFKYENSKKEKASRKHQSTVVVKEVKFRPKTDEHDLDFKVKHIRRFLAEGNKCRLVIVFRGREIVHPETGQAMLDTVIRSLGDAAVVEQRASMEGRRMVLTLGPRVGVVRPNPAPTAGAPGSAPPPSAPRPVAGPGDAPRPPTPPAARPPGPPSGGAGPARPNPPVAAPAAGARTPVGAGVGAPPPAASKPKA